MRDVYSKRVQLGQSPKILRSLIANYAAQLQRVRQSSLLTDHTATKHMVQRHVISIVVKTMNISKIMRNVLVILAFHEKPLYDRLMNLRPTILFLCTGNSCRSQMAEAWLRHLGGGRFEARSAGTQPAGFVHQLAIDAMQRLGVSLDGMRSKSWQEFDDVPIDAVITLCDFAANEPCPIRADVPLAAHWSLLDPAYYPGTDAERLEFAISIAKRLRNKIEGLIALDWSSDAATLKKKLDFLGEI